MVTKINYEENQAYLISRFNALNELGTITGIEWGAGCEAIYDDEEPDPIDVNINVYDKNGLHIVKLHNPRFSKEYNELDKIIIGALVNRIFDQNGIECPYSYPLHLDGISGLVNDARKLFRMKKAGKDLSGFKFEYCLGDLKRVDWKRAAYQHNGRRSRYPRLLE